MYDKVKAVKFDFAGVFTKISAGLIFWWICQAPYKDAGGKKNEISTLRLQKSYLKLLCGSG